MVRFYDNGEGFSNDRNPLTLILLSIAACAKKTQSQDVINKVEESFERKSESCSSSVPTKLELLLEGSPQKDYDLKDKLSCSFDAEVADDVQFADTLPMESSDMSSYESKTPSSNTFKPAEESISIKKILKQREKQYADTLPIERTGSYNNAVGNPYNACLYSLYKLN